MGVPRGTPIFVAYRVPMNTPLSPSLDAVRAEERLSTLLIPGEISAPLLFRRGERLQRLFHSSLKNSPAPPWAPGLRITREWRIITESFLPWAEIEPPLQRLISLGLSYPPPFDPLTIFPSWPDFLERFPVVDGVTADPGILLHRLLADADLRRRWLFTLFLPKEHGGGFGRYPVQQRYLREWMTRRLQRGEREISCLDAACGSGEGSWELLQLCRECGFSRKEVTIRGSSLDPLELFAAAHACFPHDQEREREYRRRIHPLMTAGFADRLSFVREDLALPSESHEQYDLILCNGLLGGPLLHDPEVMERVVAGLVRRLRPGALLLAADRFHDGWLKQSPKGVREALLRKWGMRILETGEGIGGELSEPSVVHMTLLGLLP